MNCFYEVFDDCDNTAFGYYRTFYRAYQASAEYNEECENDIPDMGQVWREIEEWGSCSVGCHTIRRIEIKD